MATFEDVEGESLEKVLFFSFSLFFFSLLLIALPLSRRRSISLVLA
jgi:hypothetical protein